MLHGGGMNANVFGPQFGPYASANDVILIVPQAVGSWESVGTIGSTPETDAQYTKNGAVMQWMKAVVD